MFLHKIKSRILLLYKQVVPLTVYNTNYGPASSAVFFNQFLDPTPNYQTKHTAAVALVDPGATLKKRIWDETPPSEKWTKTRISTNSSPLSTNTFKCSRIKNKLSLHRHKNDVFESLASSCPGCQDVKHDINPCICWNKPKPVLCWPTVAIRNVVKQKTCESTSQRTFWGLLDPLLTYMYHIQTTKPNTDFAVFSSTFHINKVNPPNNYTKKKNGKQPWPTRTVDFFLSHIAVLLGHSFGLRLHPPRWDLFRFDRDTLGFQTPAFIRSLFLGGKFLCVFFGGDDFLCSCVFVVFLIVGGALFFLKRTVFWTWKEVTLFSVLFCKWYGWEWFIICIR